MRLGRFKTLPPLRRGAADCPPRRSIKGSYWERRSSFYVSLFSLSASVKCLCEARVGGQARARSRHSRIRTCESLEGAMGALMVIFSLQPKQKAKTKGRLALYLHT